MGRSLARVAVPAELDERSIAALRQAVAGAIDDAATRVLVLHGRDGVFCRGMSLAALVRADHPADPAAALRAYARCLRALRQASRPTIAVVDGEALGGGLGIAAACDLVLATTGSRFGLPELLVGLLPAVVLPVLFERMPTQKARLLALRAESVSADRARELGLADEVVSAAELPRATLRLARALSRPGSGAAAALKRYVAATAGLEVGAGLERGAECSAAALSDPAVVGAIREFVAEGRAPWLAT